MGKGAQPVPQLCWPGCTGSTCLVLVAFQQHEGGVDRDDCKGELQDVVRSMKLCGSLGGVLFCGRLATAQDVRQAGPSPELPLCADGCTASFPWLVFLGPEERSRALWEG